MHFISFPPSKQSKASLLASSHAMNTDQILVHKLRNRTVFGPDYPVQGIIDLDHDICNYDPWNLPGCDSATPSDPNRSFIYPKSYKYNINLKMADPATGGYKPDGKRKPMMNRATKSGYWKVSGDPIKIRAFDSNEVIGIKTKLYFRLNSGPRKTSYKLYQFELTDIDPSSQNKYFLGLLMMKEFKQTNISSTSKGETSQQLNSNYSGNDHISNPEVQVGFEQETLVENEAPNDCGWIQNHTSISEQTNELITPFHVFNYETNFVNGGNEVASNLQPYNHVADYATPQIGCMAVPRSLEVPAIGDQNQFYTNQYDQPYQNIPIYNYQMNPEERSNQHNIVAEYAGFNLPSNLYNNRIDCTSQTNWSEFDDLY